MHIIAFGFGGFHSPWSFKAKEILFRNVRFTNVTTSFDHKIESNDKAFLDFTSNTVNLTNLTIENYHQSQLRVIKVISGKLEARMIKLSNITTFYPLLEIESSEAYITNSKFEYVTFPRMNATQFQNHQSKISNNPLCIYAFSKSFLVIHFSTFTNITSTCILTYRADVRIVYSRFSNQNMEKYIEQEQLETPQVLISSWIQSKQQILMITASSFETNYLRNDKGGAISCLENELFMVQHSNFTNLTAVRGGAIFTSKIKFINLIGIYFINDSAKLTGGIAHFDKSNVIIQGINIINCFSEYKGSLFYATNFQESSNFSIFYTNITLSKQGAPNLFYASQFQQIFLGRIIVKNEQIAPKNVTVFKHIKRLSQLQSTSLTKPVFILNISQYIEQNYNDQIPRYLKIKGYEVDKIQHQLQNENYFQELKSNFVKYKKQFHQIFNTSILLEENRQQLSQEPIISTRNGLYLPILLELELYDQYHQIFTKEFSQEDGFEIELFQDEKNEMIQGEKIYKFTSDSILFNPENKYLLSNLNFTKQHYLKIFQIENEMTTLQDHPYSINFNFPLKFEKCRMGEQYKEISQVCSPCALNLYSFDDPSTASCKACQKNSICLGSSIVLPQPGYWRYDQFSPQSIKCPYSDNCIGGRKIEGSSIGGNSSIKTTTEFNEQGYCKYPSTGNFCNQCEEGFVRARPQSQCVNCKTDFTGYLYFAVMFSLQIFLIISISISKIKSNIAKKQRDIEEENSNSLKYSAQESQIKTESSSNIHYLCQLIRITFNYCETLQIINKYSVEQLPMLIGTSISGISSIIPSQDIAFSIECFLELFDSKKQNHFWLKYFAVLLKPIILFIVIFLLFFLYFTKQQLKKKSKRMDQEDNKDSVIKQAFLSSIKYISTIIIVILYFSQSHIIVASLDLFNCQNVYPENGTKLYLFQDLDIECWVGIHKKITFGVAIPVLIIFGILLPIYTFYKLRLVMKLRQDLSSNSPTSRKFSLGKQLQYIFVKGSTTEENYFWEILIVVRKNLFIVTFVLLRRLDYLESVVFALLIMIVFLFVHQTRNPYKQKDLNLLESVGYCSISLLLMAQIILNGSKSQEKIIGFGFNLLFMIITLSFVILSIPKLFKMFYKVYKSSQKVKKMLKKKKFTEIKLELSEQRKESIEERLKSESRGVHKLSDMSINQFSMDISTQNSREDQQISKQPMQKLSLFSTVKESKFDISTPKSEIQQFEDIKFDNNFIFSDQNLQNKDQQNEEQENNEQEEQIQKNISQKVIEDSIGDDQKEDSQNEFDDISKEEGGIPLSLNLDLSYSQNSNSEEVDRSNQLVKQCEKVEYEKQNN